MNTAQHLQRNKPLALRPRGQTVTIRFDYEECLTNSLQDHKALFSKN